MEVLKKCEWCGKTFKRRGNPGDQNEKKFCSSAGPESCKRQYESALRSIGLTIINSLLTKGHLTMADLKRNHEPRAANSMINK